MCVCARACTGLLTEGVREGVLGESRESGSGERGWEKAKPPIFGADGVTLHGITV